MCSHSSSSGEDSWRLGSEPQHGLGGFVGWRNGFWDVAAVPSDRGQLLTVMGSREKGRTHAKNSSLIAIANPACNTTTAINST